MGIPRLREELDYAIDVGGIREFGPRKRVHGHRCGLAHGPKCKCVCGGSRHGEELKRLVEEQLGPPEQRKLKNMPFPADLDYAKLI